MIDKEQLAHDLTMTYLNNRYGVDVSGDFSVTTVDREVSGFGNVETSRFPEVSKARTKKVGTGQKQFVFFEKKKLVFDGYVVDEIFDSMITDYYEAYEKIWGILTEREQSRNK
ncbi:hypothetical protein M2149_000920 [Lachnospiraceae bacterium PFB1-21]